MTCLSTQREPSDEDLVALALVAGAEEFSKIVRRYQDAVFGVALSWVNSRNRLISATLGLPQIDVAIDKCFQRQGAPASVT